MHKSFLCLLLFATIGLQAAVRFPFPQVANYGNRGLRATNADHSLIQTQFTGWMSSFYVESGNMARIKFDQPDYTVSEGIAYGMLIMVYMSTSQRSYQPEFDKLWNYYKRWMNGNGVMHWKIQGFNNIVEQNGATDAELDAALALIMAYHQFGDSRYLTEARTLIGNIRQHEVTDGHLRPGDAWNDKKNPSYVSTAALELFKTVDQGQSSFWQTVLTNGYNMIKASQNGSTGLMPDWCTQSGSPQTDWNGQTAHLYDAARTPWRMAWAYYWFGHADARTINSRIAAWLPGATNNNPGQIRAGYTLNGTALETFSNSTFIGGLGLATAVSTNQEYVNLVWQRLSVRRTEGYYNRTLNMLYQLLISGNMPDLANSTPTNHSSSSAVTSSNSNTSSANTSSSSSSPAWWEPAGTPVSGIYVWGTYVDALGSSVSPEPGTYPVVQDGGQPVARASFNIRPEPEWSETNPPPSSAYPFAGMVASFTVDDLYQNLSTVQSIRITYKSTGYIRMGLLTAGVSAGAEFGYDLQPASSYTTITIPRSQLEQMAWAQADAPATLNMGQVRGAKFEVKMPDGGAASISVRELVFVGYTPPVSTLPARIFTFGVPEPQRFYRLDGRRVQTPNRATGHN